MSPTKLSIVDAFTNSPEKLDNLMQKKIYKLVNTVKELNAVPSVGSFVLLPLNLCTSIEGYHYCLSCINPV